MEKRKIAFRAWDKIKKEMCYKVLVGNTDFSDKNYTCNSIFEKDGGWMNADDACIDLMQFTGLKDRDGSEIYESDILKALSGLFFIVRWDNENMKWVMQYEVGFREINSTWLVVVGNIYENPDLLE